MEVRPALVVREEKPPTVALLVPLLYLAACAGCVRSFLMDRSMDIGIAGLLVAVGLVPAFVCPAIFGTRRARINADPEGLVVDGRILKINDVRIARADRGSAKLIVEMRNGDTRSFVVSSYTDAQHLMAALPPVSAPAGALAA
ncbi:MAG: hypothetical protein JWO86_2871 [Myxococcaceae bacterium]|nr:hypothetical protein [Myxococcaceae bacterium]